jgi:hypothetical protein
MTQQAVQSGSFTSLTFVSLNSQPVMPSLFAIDQSQYVVYFQPNGKGQFGNVKPFGTTTKFSQIEAVVRTGLDGDRQGMKWIGRHQPSVM